MPSLFSPSVGGKIVTLFALTTVVAVIGISFAAYPGVLLTAMLVVIVNFAFGVRMLFMALADLREIVAVVRKISYGDYNVAADEIHNPDLEVLAVMAKKLRDRDAYLTQRAYQTAILREISERMGTSLTTEEMLEIVAGSLQKVVPYSTVSYLALARNDTAVFRCHLEESVSRSFVEEVKQKILGALRSAAGITIPEENIKMTHFGTIFDDTARDQVRSFFNIPLVVNKKVVGIINVASVKPNEYDEHAIATLYNIVEQAGLAAGKVNTIVAEEIQKTDAMLAAITDGIIMAGMDGQVLVMNKKAEEILHVPDAPEHSLLDVIHALYGIFDLRGAMDEVMLSKTQKSFPEIQLERSFYNITASPVKDAKGETRAVAFVLSDITREKEIDAMKSEFISTTSHQLRTPLSSMKWFMEMLIGGDLGALTDKQKGVLTDIYNSNERIIALVNDLLDVSRIESGKIVLEPTPTNLIELIKSMLPEVKTVFEKRTQEFAFEYPESVPRLNIDPKLVWQVLANLLTNASKYTPENGKISLVLSMEPEYALIKIADNGFGIPEFQKHRIFEKFFRADNVAKAEGTGLGLYIARQIAEASGGKLWFESTEGKGTTFFFTLPLAGSRPNKIIKPTIA